MIAIDLDDGVKHNYEIFKDVLSKSSKGDASVAIEIKGKNADELIALAEFIEHFNVDYSLLLRRYKRFQEINDISNSDMDVITYFDMIIVQLRAICIESGNLKKNYTAQVLLRKINEGKLADKLDVMLNEEFLTGCSDFTIKKAIKTLADEFICHYDNYDGVNKGSWAKEAIIEKQLRNSYDKCNLEHIMATLIECIGDGLIIK